MNRRGLAPVAWSGAVALTATITGTAPAALGVALLLLTIGSIGPNAVRALSGPIRWNTLELAVAALFAWLTLGTFLRPLPWDASYQFWVVTLFGLGFLAARLATRGDLRRMAFILTIGITLFATATLVARQVTGSPSLLFLTWNNQAAMLAIGLMLASGFFASRRQRFGDRAGFAAAAVVLSAGIAVTGSRAAMLALLIATVTLFTILLAERRRWPAFAMPPVAISAGFLLADLINRGYTRSRAAELVDPFAADRGLRRTLWESAMPLVDKADHWFGFGLGMFRSHWPSVRGPEHDGTSYYLHADYLQFALEAGWPAAVLLFALPLLAALLVLLSARRRALNRDGVPIAAAALAAAVAVMSHSVVDMNLQVPVLLLLTGTMLGAVSATVRTVSVGVPVAAARIAAMACAVAIVLKSVLYTAFAVTLPPRIEGDPATVERALGRLQWAIAIEPRADEARTNLGDLYRQAAAVRHGDPAFRASMYVAARQQFDAALETHPRSTHALYGRARLELDYRDREGAVERAESDLRAALAAEPRMYVARTRLVRILRERGQVREALAVARAGWPYLYIRSPEYLEYLDELIRAGAAAGASEAERDARARRAEVLRALPWYRAPDEGS